MPTEQTVFDRHYHDYLNRLKGVDLQSTALKLGITFDKDEEFDAKCSVLFERRVESYLDAECIAMTGRLLYLHLKNVGG